MGDASDPAAGDAERRKAIEADPPDRATLSDRSMAVAVITLARYLVRRDPGAVIYLQDALEQAKAAGLSTTELATLALVVRAVGGA